MKYIDPKKLFKIRKEAYKNQLNFAQKIPMEHKTYAAKEKSGKFSLLEIKKISELLQCSPDDLMTESVPTHTDDLATIKATLKVFQLLITDLQMKSTGNSLADVTMDIERLIRKELGGG